MAIEYIEDMRSGYTTGSCVAAALKASIIYLQTGHRPQKVAVLNPQDRPIEVPVAGGSILQQHESAECWVIKDAGDDPDITHGTSVYVRVQLRNDGERVIKAGEGIGIVTKPGLNIPVGQPAINKGPRVMIEKVFEECLQAEQGLEMIISVPAGRELAKKTLNPALGIEGGISIIGTTGIVYPMSEEAFKDSLKPQFEVVKAAGYKIAVMAPGKIGMEIAEKYKLPVEAMVQTSNFIGFMLEQAVRAGFTEVIIWGHIGKLVKLAGGIFHTHSHIADARQEIFASQLALMGASSELIAQVLDCVTTEAIITLLQNTPYSGVYKQLAEKARKRAEQHVYGELTVGIVFVSMAGELLAVDDNARAIGEKMAWNLK
ncbi:cobalt-precorrin-5B (C(1))-methyltransferase CbiD [Succinispira mobilis]|uniref:cobalt-precorrin-5B (C(1))-methyltransferase CbiD n=1 Tax=Succinispira mobilis TaxID=78120 RepID=UPI000373A5E7|nr:cobalt-precorrin-5B (C(1))-methyltransferase CbiD [Succinispira mobilis]